MWEVDFTAQAQRWADSLDMRQAEQLKAARDELRKQGPALGQPFVKPIKSSRHRGMKELRPLGTNLRALFVLDSDGKATVLVGGDKTDQWKSWYRRNVPRADRLYDQHLRKMGKEAGWRTMAPRSGARSVASGR